MPRLGEPLYLGRGCEILIPLLDLEMFVFICCLNSNCYKNYYHLFYLFVERVKILTRCGGHVRRQLELVLVTYESLKLIVFNVY